MSARVVQRARIVLLWAQGYWEWKSSSGWAVPSRRCSAGEIVLRSAAWLVCRIGRGRASAVGRSDQAVGGLWLTVNRLPVEGVTHWSTRLLAKKVGVRRFTVARVWAHYGLETVPARDVQVLDRSVVGGQGS